MARQKVTRRGLVRRCAAAAAMGIAGFHVRGAHAAGRLSVGFLDHRIPGANGTLTRLCNEWASRERVELSIDYITSSDNKIPLTIAAEAQARTGHDILAFPPWYPAEYARQLEPVDDVMGELTRRIGAVSQPVEYLGRVSGKWLAVPATPGSQLKLPCARIDLMKQHAGIDVQAMYPAGAAPKADDWTWDAFLAAAEKCSRSRTPFALPLGQTSDAVDWVGALFQSYGAQLVNSRGDVTVNSDAVKQVLEYAKRLERWLPTDIFSWDDSLNDRWLISGRSALIIDTPRAWNVARRDAPQVAQDSWMLGMPSGPKGRFAPFLPYFWGIWNFSRNKTAAKSLILALCQPASIEKLVEASLGHDVPTFANLAAMKIWREIEPPKGTLYHYPNPHQHHVQSIAAAPGPTRIASQIYTQATMTKMIARVTALGEPIDRCIEWAQRELQGFKRA